MVPKENPLKKEKTEWERTKNNDVFAIPALASLVAVTVFGIKYFYNTYIKKETVQNEQEPAATPVQHKPVQVKPVKPTKPGKPRPPIVGGLL